MKESTTENFRPAVRAIAYIESQLSMPCDLQKVAEQAGYSKYYMHRLFSKETGMTLCQYIRRRKLTEAARLLVFSKQPIMDIALAAGYESRQAFTGIFKELYKKTPGQYRKDGFFYPLQLRYPPEEFPDGAPEPAGKAGWEDGAREQGRRGSRIRTASEKDMGKWMELVRLVIDGYPCLEEEAYKETLGQNIRQKRALILEHNDKAAGIMAFDESRGFIDFLGIHPGYSLAAAMGMGFFLSGKGSLRFSRQGSASKDSLKENQEEVLPRPSGIRSLGILAQSCANGFSELVSQSAAAVTTFLFNITMIKLLGEPGVAAITILIYTQFFLTALYIGFSMGVAPIISYRSGTGDRMGLSRMLRRCIAVISILSVLIFSGTRILAEPLVGIFSPEGTRVYEIAGEGFSIFPISFLFCGINIFASAAFTALSKGKLSALISMLRTFALMAPGILLLPRALGVTGVWLAVPLAEGLTMAVSAWLLGRNAFSRDSK